ncbi:MAG: hypothetical protein H3C42_03755 [Phycisphaerae bacterium]|jgi:hypothetical protein|nr:hypothetical protein [Phycisphaerae bacterium]
MRLFVIGLAFAASGAAAQDQVRAPPGTSQATGADAAGARPIAPALEARALARARTTLMRLASDLPIGDGLSVGRWAAQDPNVDRALRAWLRARPPHGPARRFHGDGGNGRACDVDVRLDAQTLLDRLLELRTAHRSMLSEERVRAAARGWPRLWATGDAAENESPPTSDAPGWEDVTPAGLEMAREAAAALAILELLEQCAALKLTPVRTLAEIVVDGQMRDALRGILAAASETTVELEAGQVVRAEACIDVARLAAALREFAYSDPAGRDLGVDDFREMVLRARASRLCAVGHAVPPDSQRPQHEPAAPCSGAPAWARQTIRTTGRTACVSVLVHAAVREELARQDAIQRLRDEALALPAGPGLTVGQRLGYDTAAWPESAAMQDFETFLAAARLTGAAQAGDERTFSVEVELPLRRLWLIVGSRLEQAGGAQPRDADAADEPGGKGE